MEIALEMNTMPHLKLIKAVINRFFLLVGLCSLYFTSTSQSLITSFGIDRGMSDNSVKCIYKDHTGFMWFGGLDGLNRYDGYDFRVYRRHLEDSNSLIFSVITALGEDSRGQLWVGTRQGLSVYNSLSDNFKHLRVDESPNSITIVRDVINAIATDSLNGVLVGTQNEGLLLCRNGELVGHRIPLELNGKDIRKFGSVAIEIAPDGKVWTFVQNHGLCVLDYASMKLRLVQKDTRRASVLKADGNEMWVGTDEGVFNYNTSTQEYKRKFGIDDAGRYSNRVTSLLVDKEHQLWIGTYNSGICIWNTSSKSMKRLLPDDSKYSLSTSLIYSIFEDEQGRKWIGTSKGGVNVIDPGRGRFQLIAHDPAVPNGLRGKIISAFCETRDSVLWIGSEDGGLSRWDRRTNIFHNIDYITVNGHSMPIGMIRSLCKGKDGQLWMANSPNGAGLLNEQTRQFKQYHCINPVTGRENPIVYLIYKGRNDSLWATTLRQGNQYGALYLFNSAADKFEAFDTRLSDLFSLTEDRAGVLWGGNLNQLVKIDKKYKKHQFYAIDNTIDAIYEDKAGNFWIGAEGGGLILFNREKGRIEQRYTTRDGLCSDAVLKILEDSNGNLWMITLNGLSKFNPSHRTFKNYYYNDGLQSNQFNYNGAAALENGEFVVGGLGGINIFRPEEIVASREAAPLAMTSVTVNNRSVRDDSTYITDKGQDEIRELTIPYNEAIVSFHFAALEYSVPEKISYAYYLEGWDRKWNYVNNNRTANYTHLSEGKYIFRFKSSNPDGEWNSKEMQVRLIVLPPWYRSWWAYVVYGAVLVSVFYVLWLYRLRQARLQYQVSIAKLNAQMEKANREKERAEHETERVINEKEKELAEKRLNFFTNITHEFRTPLTLIINPLKSLLQTRSREITALDSSELNIVYRNARRMRSLIDQLLLFRKEESKLDALRPVKLNFSALAHDVYLCFVQQAKADNVCYTFECANPDIELYVDREKMEIVLYNLLSNAIKYTPAGGNIHFEVEDGSGMVYVHISDTGPGISKEAGGKIFDKFFTGLGKGITTKPGFGIGLYLVKQFMLQHKGTVGFDSNEGKGTMFHLELRKGKGHFDEVIDIQEAQEPITALTEPVVEGEADLPLETAANGAKKRLEELVSSRKSVLIADDDKEMRRYLDALFRKQFTIYQATDGIEGLEIAQKYIPDIIISDVKMDEGDGIAFCKAVKSTPALSHIPVILLTATTSDEIKLSGVESGADDYITKPFDKDLLVARVQTLLKNRENLQRYFYNEVTLRKNDLKISEEYKAFLEKCISIVEANLENDQFSVKDLTREIGMSHSSVFKKIKEISGQSINGFIRFIRLRKAAELFINTTDNIGQVADAVGIIDRTHFRQHFLRQFGMPPAEYIKRFRRAFGNDYGVDKQQFGKDNPES